MRGEQPHAAQPLPQGRYRPLECSCEAGRNAIRCWHLAYALQAERIYAAVDAQHGRKTPLLQPVPTTTPAVPFHETAAYKRVAGCFA